jgi:hypothetical protein
MASTQAADLTQVAAAFIKAFDAGDWQQFRAPLSSDVAYEETGTGRRTEDAETYVKLGQGHLHLGDRFMQELCLVGSARTRTAPGRSHRRTRPTRAPSG